MKLCIALVMFLAFAALAGCGEESTQSTRTQAPDESRPASMGGGIVQAELPPAGKPVVGRKPPMPEPVNVASPSGYRVADYATGLVIPWDMAFLPDGRMYVTERPGRVRVIENNRLQSKPYATISTAASGEGGLMGIALHPNYPDPPYVYLMYTYRHEGRVYNRVSRFRDTGSGLTDERPMVTRIPGALYHNGGIIRFGPDGMLYIGTGDGGEPERAQDRSSLAGKILRIDGEGRIPDDNPIPGSPVYAIGFRNVQGIAWNPANGDLWVTTHGPTGEFGLRAKDGVYIVPKGSNGGWPRVLGVTDYEGVLDPVLFFPDVAVPPALAVFYNADLMPDLQGNFFFASLRGEHLQRVVLDGARRITRIERWFQTGTQQGRYGRLRAVAVGPDGALYVSTSNLDRGNPRAGDDRILRITPR